MPVQRNFVRLTLAPALASVVLWAGCSQPSGADKANGAAGTTETATVAPDSAAEGDVSAGEVKLQVVDKAGFDEVLARHRGAVVFVDYWATWCAPCVKGFPHTVELAQKHKDDGLVVISVSFDDPEDGNDQSVLEFLKSQGATFENFISSTGSELESYDAFGVETGALPHYQIYDRSGKLVAELASGDPDAVQATPENLDAALSGVLLPPIPGSGDTSESPGETAPNESQPAE